MVIKLIFYRGWSAVPTLGSTEVVTTLKMEEITGRLQCPPPFSPVCFFEANYYFPMWCSGRIQLTPLSKVHWIFESFLSGTVLCRAMESAWRGLHTGTIRPPVNPHGRSRPMHEREGGDGAMLFDLPEAVGFSTGQGFLGHFLGGGGRDLMGNPSERSWMVGDSNRSWNSTKTHFNQISKFKRWGVKDLKNLTCKNPGEGQDIDIHPHFQKLTKKMAKMRRDSCSLLNANTEACFSALCFEDQECNSPTESKMSSCQNNLESRSLS